MSLIIGGMPSRIETIVCICGGGKGGKLEWKGGRSRNRLVLPWDWVAGGGEKAGGQNLRYFCFLKARKSQPGI